MFADYEKAGMKQPSAVRIQSGHQTLPTDL
jgi:hypothetical protein